MQQHSKWFQSLTKIQLFVWFLSTVATIILTLMITEMYDSWTEITPSQILRQLHNPDSTLKVKLQIEDGITTFQQDESVNLFYSVTGTLKGETFYANLVNISASGQVYPIFQEEVICAGYDYSLPTLVNVNCPKKFKPIDKRVRFTHTGQEYFKLIITSNPIKWETIVTRYKANELQLEQPWGTAELKVDIKPNLSD